MSRNIKFIWCLLAALLFCAVTYGGCGGSSNMAQPVNITSEDVALISADITGRNEGWEEMTAFEFFDNTAWRITDVQFIGDGVKKVEYDKTARALDWVRFDVYNYSQTGGTEWAEIRTNYEHVLDFSVTLSDSRYWFRDETIVGSGYFQKAGNFFITEPVNGNYYMIEMVSATKMIFTNARYELDGVLMNYQIVTTLEFIGNL